MTLICYDVMFGPIVDEKCTSLKVNVISDRVHVLLALEMHFCLYTHSLVCLYSGIILFHWCASFVDWSLQWEAVRGR